MESGQIFSLACQQLQKKRQHNFIGQSKKFCDLPISVLSQSDLLNELLSSSITESPGILLMLPIQIATFKHLTADSAVPSSVSLTSYIQNVDMIDRWG